MVFNKSMVNTEVKLGQHGWKKQKSPPIFFVLLSKQKLKRVVILMRKEMTTITNQICQTLMGTTFSPVYISWPSYDRNSVSCVYNKRHLNQQSDKSMQQLCTSKHINLKHQVNYCKQIPTCRLLLLTGLYLSWY